MADGSQLTVPIYRIGGVVIGAECWLSDVEAAVFPGSTRFILGLSGLRQAAPFIFSLDPPQLVLSNCGDASTLAAQGARMAVDEDAADVAMAESDVPVLAAQE